VTQSTTRFPPTLTFGDRAGSKTGVANYLPGNDIDVGANGGSDQPSASFTVNTLRFNGEDTLYLSGINTISTGGILITDNAFEDNIDGGALRAGAGQELVLINYGVGPVTLSSQLVDASSGPSGVTYLGTTGNTILSGQTQESPLSMATSSLSAALRSPAHQGPLAIPRPSIRAPFSLMAVPSSIHQPITSTTPAGSALPLTRI
jgi:hypothetical protein